MERQAPSPNLLQRWRDAQRQLDKAIQCYLQRAADIEAATSSPIHYSADHYILETAIQEAYQDLQVLPIRADRLLKARTTLNRLRNRSTSLAPVNKLPLEVLLQIFRLTVWRKPCVRCDPSASNPTIDKYDHLKSAITLTHVCKSWRKIAIEIPSFWSHVGIALGAIQKFLKSFDGVKACLQRAHNSPLCVWIDGNDNVTDAGLEMLINLLHSHLDSLESFTLINHRNHPRILRFISLWLTHGQAGSLRTLTVWLEIALKKWVLYSNNPMLSEQRVASLLEPIRVLRLRGVCFDWDSPVYHNLVVLRLSNPRSSLTTPKLRSILSACPQLHTLQLWDMIISTEEEDSPHPVVLAELKYLDVQGITSGGLHEIFTMITPQRSQDLTLAVDLYSISSNDSSAIQSFLAHSNVTQLALLSLTDADLIAQHLSVATNLSTLILGCGGKRTSRANYLTSMHSTARSRPHCYKLHAVHLQNGALGNEGVQEAVEAHLRSTEPGRLSCIYDLFDEDLLDQLDPFLNDVEYGKNYDEVFIDISQHD